MTALERVRAAYRRIAEVDRPEVWIALRPAEEAEAEARRVDERAAGGSPPPLAGTVLAVKGNIDVAGLPTTAGCPSYGYRPARDATAVARLRAAGAVVVGVTNLDQFATGLVGTRSPYGAVRGALDPDRVSGGSSSGSAVAVALGIADLALGTDTAGSGRVPAAFNGIVGVKPTRGLVPADGVVPACASLDCVSVFARTLPEARRAAALLADPPGRPVPPAHDTPPGAPARRPGPWRVAVAHADRLGPLAPGWADGYRSTARRLAAAGAELAPFDPEAFIEAGALLYEGAFVAERYTAVGAFLDRDPAPPDLDPVVAGIIRAARDLPAHRLFADLARRDTLRGRVLAAFGDADALLLPTAPFHPTLAEVRADPVGVNTALGRFTNAVNLLDLCAVAVPAGNVPGGVGGLPFGVTLVGRAFADDRIADIAALLGPPVRLAVVGAHLSGQPLNHQVLDEGGRLLATTRTAPVYRMHALRTSPAKPGLVRVGAGGGSVEAELWELPAAGLGRLLAGLPRPMALGRIDLADGGSATGFLCEPDAVEGAPDITADGGWRAHLARTGTTLPPGRPEPSTAR